MYDIIGAPIKSAPPKQRARLNRAGIVSAAITVALARRADCVSTGAAKSANRDLRARRTLLRAPRSELCLGGAMGIAAQLSGELTQAAA